MKNIWYNIKHTFQKILARSYGMDELNKVLIYTSLILNIFNNILFKSTIIYLLVSATSIWFLFRFFSTNRFKRFAENMAYNKIKKFAKVSYDLRKTHKVLMCNKCGQIIRIPKGAGYVEVTCPSCKNTFDARA